MAYRIQRNGYTIEADTVAEVQALIGAAPEEPSRAKPQARKKAPRGTSDGALHGRILSALASGPMSPAKLSEAVKADRYYVQKAIYDLVDTKKVRVEGATTNRLVMLAGTRAKDAA